MSSGRWRPGSWVISTSCSSSSSRTPPKRRSTSVSPESESPRDGCGGPRTRLPTCSRQSKLGQAGTRGDRRAGLAHDLVAWHLRLARAARRRLSDPHGRRADGHLRPDQRKRSTEAAAWTPTANSSSAAKPTSSSSTRPRCPTRSSSGRSSSTSCPAAYWPRTRSTDTRSATAPPASPMPTTAHWPSHSRRPSPKTPANGPTGPNPRRRLIHDHLPHYGPGHDAQSRNWSLPSIRTVPQGE